MTAWCEPGQLLLSGGYELQGAEPFVPAPDATGTTTTSEPPVVFVAASHPTYRTYGDGSTAQFGWTAVPNTIGGEAGPLTAYAICAGRLSARRRVKRFPRPRQRWMRFHRRAPNQN